MQHPGTLTTLIILITSIFTITALNKPALLKSYHNNSTLIKTYNQKYRLLTAGFLHGSALHLFVNMYTLFSFGPYLERFFNQISSTGPVIYLIFYLTSIIASNIPGYLKHQHNPNFSSLGASGAISAVVASTVLFAPNATLLPLVIPIKAYLFLALFMLGSYYFAVKRTSRIDHLAHLAGALYGLLATLCLGYLYQVNLISHFLNSIQAS